MALAFRLISSSLELGLALLHGAQFHDGWLESSFGMIATLTGLVVFEALPMNFQD
jgi:hypothetical protein